MNTPARYTGRPIDRRTAKAVESAHAVEVAEAAHQQYLRATTQITVEVIATVGASTVQSLGGIVRSCVDRGDVAGAMHVDDIRGGVVRATLLNLMKAVQ